MPRLYLFGAPIETIGIAKDYSTNRRFALASRGIEKVTHYYLE
jgi:hypothetical protein